MNASQEHYEITKSKPPTKLLTIALQYVKNKDKAIDIGAGALKDTRYLLDQGFDVTVIDKNPRTKEDAENLKNDKVHAFTASFEDFDFTENQYDIASAMLSLPFIKPAYFNKVFEKIRNSLKKDGIFCGQFLGLNDEWAQNPHNTFHTKSQVENLLAGLEIILFQEEEIDGIIAKGSPKHWHVFRIIARKK